MVGLTLVPALLQVFGFTFLIESPGWLFKVDKDFEGVQAIKKLYSGNESAIIKIMQTQKEEADRIKRYENIGFWRSIQQLCTTYKA